MKAPSTKAEFLNRLLQFDFTGFPSLGATAIKRVSDNILQIELPTGVFRLAIQRPKPEAARLAAKERWHKRFGAGKVAKRKADPKKGQPDQKATQH